MTAEWQPIETAPANRAILVCDEQGGMPFTIAKVGLLGFGTFCYAGTDEEIDFVPLFWCEKGVDENPFHMPLPSVEATDHAR